MAKTKNAVPRSLERHTFKPGESGNVSGRPKGIRRALSEKFLQDMRDDWNEHGVAAIQTFRAERPHEYVKVMATLVPRQFSMKVTEHDELSDEQLHAQLNAVLRELAEAGVEPGAGSEAAEGPQQAGTLPTLQ